MNNEKSFNSTILKEVKRIDCGDDTVMSIDDVAKFTGYSKKYIYKLTCLKKIPFTKTLNGRKLFFFKSQIIDWITKGKFSPFLE